MPIGELSRLCGVHIETIRYYEKIGMLPAPPRTESGRRVYGPKETRILVFIRRGRELGFTLDQIRALLNLGGPGKASCAEVDAESLGWVLGDAFELIEMRRHQHMTPWGSEQRLQFSVLRRAPGG